MKNELDNIDDLIAKYLAGETSAEENTFLNNWKQQSAENEAYYEEAVKLFSQIDSFITSRPVDTDKAWNNVDSRILKPEAKVISLNRNKYILRAAVAAAILTTLSVIVKISLLQNNEKPFAIAATTTTVNQSLPDGSKVFVNKNTELTYSVNSHNEREVKLKGEAYFDVVHNDKQPFVITVNDVLIKDIGTSFNVKAQPDSDRVEVNVESGVVLFYSKTSSGLKLVKGEKAIYSRQTKQFTKLMPEVNENAFSYKTKLFRYEETPLKEVIRQVNDVYSTNIVLLDDKTGNCKLSVEFNNEKPEVIVSIIAETLNLQVEHQGKTIILKGPACP